LAKKKQKNLDRRRKLRKMRKTAERSPVRDKKWNEQYRQGAAEDIATPPERMISRHDRRSSEIETARAMLHEQQLQDAGEIPEGATRGVVVQVVPGGCIVDVNGKQTRCVLRGLLKSLETQQRNIIAVGDEVYFTLLDDHTGVVERITTRRSVLSRKYKQREHVVAANVDQLIVITSVAAPPIRTGLIDRYLAAAENVGLDSIICINKIDLAEDDSHVRQTNIYRELGYGVISCSAQTGDGLDGLKDILHDKKSIFAGQSGVGKSSILNAIQPGLNIRTAEISEATRKGMHTTTTVELIALGFGGYVVDTPGIREFALWDIDPQVLPHLFPEFEEYLGTCKLRGCSHTHEPGCSVKDAIEQGKINGERYDSYCRILESLTG